MDLQRNLLIGAAAVLLFMLLTEWVAFSDERSAKHDKESPRLLNERSAQNNDLPEPVSELPAADDDLPDMPADAIEEQAPSKPDTSTPQNLVRVETDVLKFVIDLTGGDILELSLPKHLEHLGEDQPMAGNVPGFDGGQVGEQRQGLVKGVFAVPGAGGMGVSAMHHEPGVQGADAAQVELAVGGLQTHPQGRVAERVRCRRAASAVGGPAG